MSRRLVRVRFPTRHFQRRKKSSHPRAWRRAPDARRRRLHRRGVRPGARGVRDRPSAGVRRGRGAGGGVLSRGGGAAGGGGRPSVEAVEPMAVWRATLTAGRSVSPIPLFEPERPRQEFRGLVYFRRIAEVLQATPLRPSPSLYIGMILFSDLR